jgi:hypothetical protein
MVIYEITLVCDICHKSDIAGCGETYTVSDFRKSAKAQGWKRTRKKTGSGLYKMVDICGKCVTIEETG